jgi:hypothetical protein
VFLDRVDAAGLKERVWKAELNELYEGGGMSLVGLMGDGEYVRLDGAPILPCRPGVEDGDEGDAEADGGRSERADSQ